MPRILSDGSVIPSYLSTEPMGYTESMGSFDSMALMVGEIQEIIYPDDKRNVNKKFIEYRVAMQYRQGQDPAAGVEFANCLLMNSFGGAADQFKYTLRPDSKEEKAEGTFGRGSKVLVLCLNGESSRSYIIGGIRDSSLDEPDENEGHSLSFKFNGISFGISADGAAKLSFNGPTKADGTLDTSVEGASDENGPTTLELKADGSFKLSTKDDNQSILVDHANKSASFAFDEEFHLSVNGTVNESSDDDWTLDVGSTLTAKASETVEIEAGSTLTLKATGRSYIRSAGLQIGAATDSMMKGTTYRLAQQGLHQQLLGALATLSTQIATAGAAITAAVGPLAIPITGPAAAAAILAPAGIALSGAAASISQMSTAIAGFEGQSAGFLSTVNNND
jgi:hypothetical protein